MAFQKKLEFLYIVQDPGNIQSALNTLNSIRFPHRLHMVRGLSEGINYLKRKGPYSAAIPPDMIFIDDRISDTASLDMFEDMSAHPHIASIPVVVLSRQKKEFSSPYSRVGLA